jgi:poly-beta-1,6-N-acetyl-D-glucosamine synthase
VPQDVTHPAPSNKNRRKRGEASHMNEARFGPGEYQARPHYLPPFFLSTLAVILLAFGGTLTIALPWNILDLINGREFQNLSLLHRFVWDLFAVSSFLMLLRWCAIQCLAFRAELVKRTTPSYDSPAWPSVSILVPAYQEAENIESTLRSLVQLEYPSCEIIVVDDGSSDATFGKSYKFSGKHGGCTVSVLRKDNGGKWSALNFAFKHAKYEFILCVDADSRLSRDALKLLVPHMRDPRIAAVCGQVTVRNRVNMITKLQALEYIISNGGLKTVQSHLGSVVVVPGPIGLYRRSNLEQIAKVAGKVPERAKPGHIAGPLSDETFAEDFQLSLTALALNGRIVYEPRAIAYTRAPENILSLINQRYRWLRGSMQVISMYKTKLRALCNAGNRKKLDLIINWFLFDIYVLPLINFAVLFACLFMIASEGFLGGHAFAWFLAIFLLNVMTATFYILSQGDEFPLLTSVVALDLYQCLLINSAWVAAVADQLRKSDMTW